MKRTDGRDARGEETATVSSFICTWRTRNHRRERGGRRRRHRLKYQCYRVLEEEAENEKKPRKAGKGRSVRRIIPQENSSYEEFFLRKLQEKRDARTHAQKRRRRRGVSEAVQSGLPMAGTIRFPLLSCSLRTPLHSSQHWIRSTSKTR